MIHKNTQSGFSLIETLVAIAILLIAIVGPLSIVSRSFEGAVYARQQVQASFLAQEGLELVYLLRNQAALDKFVFSVGSWDWTPPTLPSGIPLYNCFTSGGCGVWFNDATGSLSFTSDDCAESANTCMLRKPASPGRSHFVHGDASVGEPTPFTRVITITKDGDELKVVSEVTWSAGLLGRDQTTTVVGYIYNIYE